MQSHVTIIEVALARSNDVPCLRSSADKLLRPSQVSLQKVVIVAYVVNVIAQRLWTDSAPVESCL